jgi:hypothetical protein
MELFKEIRQKIGSSILKQKIAGTKRKTHYTNIDHVKKIGIVWDASNTEEFACLSRFYQKMHEHKIEVAIFGYFAGNNLPDQYTALRYLTCLKKNELNTFYLPLTKETDAFLNNHYDVLIDINFKKIFPLKYITSLSNAGFKVGIFDSENGNSPFDLMMEIKKPVKIDDYLDQVVHYLEMINAETDKKSDLK